MKTLQSFFSRIILVIGLICLLCGFCRAQNITAEYTKVDSTEVTKKIYCEDYPNSKKAFKIYLNKVFDKLKFKDNRDAITFYLYIQLCDYGSDYEYASKQLLKQTNDWLKDKYKW